jgi:nitrogen fixation protein FixH
MMQDVNLVTDKYYESSLQYQDEIDKHNRSNLLNEKVKINFNGEEINILFPQNYLSRNISGQIDFYRPSDPKLDFTLQLLLVEGNQIVPVSSIEKGFWRVKLNWMMDGNGYYSEKAITVQ